MRISSVANLLCGGIDIDAFLVLLDHVNPSDQFGGKTMPGVLEWRFCDVMDVANKDIVSISFEMISRYMGIDRDLAMKSNSGEYMSLLKFIRNEIEKAGKLMEQLKTDPEPDMVAAGIDKLDRFGVVSIYYGIDKNPLNWDSISEVSFGKMFTKLMIDKTSAEIQESYSRILTNKAKHAR